MLVVADAELGVGQAPVWSGALEVRLDAQQLGVPARGRLHVVGPVVDRGESRNMPFLLVRLDVRAALRVEV
jgi:hypothetical protein